MGVILNPRGPGGSGKTEFVRRIMAVYGWSKGLQLSDRFRPVYRDGRGKPIAYVLSHPHEGRPLTVIGHYEGTSGGCDTIRRIDGGLPEVFRMVDVYAASGHDVLFEGLQISREWERSAALARRHDLRVLRLDTSVEQCVSNLLSRRHMRRDLAHSIIKVASADDSLIAQACESVGSAARVTVAGFDDALAHARELLGLSGCHADAAAHDGRTVSLRGG